MSKVTTKSAGKAPAKSTLKKPDLGANGASAYLRFDARSGQWTAKGGTADGDLDLPVRLSVDLENARAGVEHWAGGAPERVYDTPDGDARAPDGSRDWKRFIELPTYGDEALSYFDGAALGARTFGSASKMVLGEIDRLFDHAIAKGYADGVLEVEVRESKPVKLSQGTFHRPVFEVRGWIDRPAELVEYAKRVPG